MVIGLNTKVNQIPNIGPIFQTRLKKLGIETVEDFLYYPPFRFLDYSLISGIAHLQAGETVTIKGQIEEFTNSYTQRGKNIQQAVISDGSGKIKTVWFNQSYLSKNLPVGTKLNLAGKVDFWGKSLALISPEYEIVGKSRNIHTGNLIPIYHETYGLSSKWIRTKIFYLLENIKPTLTEFLPEELLKKNNLIRIDKALERIHFPKDLASLEEAKARLAFDEVFLLQLKNLIRKHKWQKNKISKKLIIDKFKIANFIENLSFKLTKAQNRVVKEILADLNADKPMNRLLEGDVGSGKTIVAAIAIYAVKLNGLKSLLMAPTEILAQQHFQTISSLLSPYGIKIGLLTSSKKMGDNDCDVIIGTQALLYKKDLSQMGLVVIDEQHRFGVEQRSQLVKGRKAPHVLTLTATPIPRTIALTYLGDLDLSIIDEKPPGRKEVKTWVVGKEKREKAYAWMADKIKNREQAFIVCPFIEPSETMQTVKSAKAEFEKLKSNVFPDFNLGLIHGKLKAKEKDQVLTEFREAKIDILVATPIVEVGIDIPNATLLLIEGAERFGLAALHQLRGRVGRADKQSYCLLFTDIPFGKPLARLKALERMNEGSQIAQFDLKMRGPGEVYGTRQHGIPEFKFAQFGDLPLINKTKTEADIIFRTLNKFPLLQAYLKKDKISVYDTTT